MKKFANYQMIVCGAAFALMIALTASNAQAQNNAIRRAEPARPNNVQVPHVAAMPQKTSPQMAQQPQHRPAIAQAPAVMPTVNHYKPTPVVMPNHQPSHHPMIPTAPTKYEPPRVAQPVAPAHHVTVNPPHVQPAPQKTVIVEQQPQIIVVQPKKTLLDRLFDKIF